VGGGVAHPGEFIGALVIRVDGDVHLLDIFVHID
jgi:hypothetical protein